MLMEKHAQHVVLIHFPIALFVAGVALDFAAQWTKRQALGFAAYTNLLLAAVMALPAVATGLVAWQWALAGHRVRGVLLLHMVFGLTSTALIVVVWLIHFRARRGAATVLPNYRAPGWISQRSEYVECGRECPLLCELRPGSTLQIQHAQDCLC